MAFFDGISTLAKRAADRFKGSGAHIEAHVFDYDTMGTGGAVEMVDMLRDEARKIHRAVEDEAIQAIHEYMGNQWASQRDTGSHLDSQYGSTVLQAHIRDSGSDDDTVRAVINRTQNAILSNTEARTSRPVQIRFEPEESGEPGEYWLTKEGAKTLIKLRAAQEAELDQAIMAQGAEMQAAAVLPDASASAQPVQPIDEEAARQQLDTDFPDVLATFDEMYGPTAPLSESEAGAVKRLIDGGLLKPDDLQKIDDDAVADAVQKVSAALNRAANLDGKYLRAVNNSTDMGWCFVRVTYVTRGDKKNRIHLEPMNNVRSVWIDPYHDDIADADYVGEDRLVSLERAKVMYPELGDELLEQLVVNGGDGGNDELGRGNYNRQMLRITTCWIRHDTVPVSIDRALRENWVIEQAVTVQSMGEDGIETEETILDEESGEPKKVYYLTAEGAEHVGDGAEEGEEVEPQIERDHKTHWPDAEGLRQLVTIDGHDEPVQDVRCPYWDIPYILLINVPRVDGSPLGQGDAQRLRDIQREINRLASIIINNQRWAQCPTMVKPQTVHDAMMSTGVGLFLNAGEDLILPDAVIWNVLQNGGFEKLIIRPPEISQSATDLLEKLLSEHDNLSGNVGVRQGRTPQNQGMSGVAIAQLQEHSMGTLALKARLDEHALTRYGRIQQHAIVTWFPETEWKKIVSKYEIPVLRRVIERASTLDFNVQVSVAAGRGIAKQLDKAQAMEEYQAGLASVEDTLVALEKEDAQARAERIIMERGAAQPTGGAATPSPDQVAIGPK